MPRPCLHCSGMKGASSALCANAGPFERPPVHNRDKRVRFGLAVVRALESSRDEFDLGSVLGTKRLSHFGDRLAGCSGSNRTPTSSSYEKLAGGWLEPFAQVVNDGAGAQARRRGCRPAEAILRAPTQSAGSGPDQSSTQRHPFLDRAYSYKWSIALVALVVGAAVRLELRWPQRSQSGCCSRPAHPASSFLADCFCALMRWR
jgi:hypothetical protein